MAQILAEDFFNEVAPPKEFIYDNFKALVRYYCTDTENAATIEIFDTAEDKDNRIILLSMHQAYITWLNTLPESIAQKYKPAVQDNLIDFINSVQENIVDNFDYEANAQRDLQ